MVEIEGSKSCIEIKHFGGQMQLRRNISKFFYVRRANIKLFEEAGTRQNRHISLSKVPLGTFLGKQIW